MTDFDVTGMSVRDLIRLHRKTLHELHDLGVVRTRNQPQGEWAELIVAEAYNGKIADNASETAWDVKTKKGQLIQVKARVIQKPSDTFSPFRHWGFDTFIAVILDTEDLSVVEGYSMTKAKAKKNAHFVRSLNGDRLSVSQVRKLGKDISDELRRGERKLG